MARSQRSAKLQARKTMTQLKDSYEDTGSYDKSIAKGGVACPFPWRLHEMLEAAENEGLTSLVSWQPHGRSFTVYDPKEFAEKIMCRFFSQTKYASFQRQLNLYGFSRLAHGPDKGAYFHMCFVRSDREKVRGMVRRKIKGTKVRRALSVDEEPNFYDSKWQRVTAPSSGLEVVALSNKVEDVPKKPYIVPSVVISPPNVPTSHQSDGDSNSSTTWEAFDEVKDNDFWLFDGTNFFDECLLDATNAKSERNAGTIEAPLALSHSMSHVSLDRLTGV